MRRHRSIASDQTPASFEKTCWSDRFRRFHTRVHHVQSKVLHFIKEISGYRVVRVFRNYSAFSIVASSALLVSASNFAHDKDPDSMLFGYVHSDSSQAEGVTKRRLAAQVSKKENLALVPLANAPSAVDPDQKDDATLYDLQGGNVQDSIILSSQAGAPSMSKDPEEDGGVKIYTVASGDTISGIAAKFGITVNTILWANDFDNVDEIKPGDQIFILPVAGLSYVVQSGDTIDTIATKYKAEKDKIIAFNSLPANGELHVGDSIIIPDGKKDMPAQTSASQSGLERRQYASSTGGAATDISGYRTLSGNPSSGHRFPYGWCTWYVAQKRYVPWGGNAGTWLYNAKALGYKTGRKPAVGAIMVTTENRYYGHVALVERVDGDTITVSEMNYVKWGKVDRRTLSASSRAVKGFIY